MNRFLIIILFLFSATASLAQLGGRPQGLQLRPHADDELSYLNPKEYIVGGITVSGTQYLEPDILIQISKLVKGERISVPGDATSNAVKNLWQQGLLDDVQLRGSLKGDTIFFNIAVSERPRLTRMDFKGMKKGETDDIKEKLKDKTGRIVNEALKSTTSAIIKKFFHEKGYLFTEVNYEQKKDTTEANNVILVVNVDK